MAIEFTLRGGITKKLESSTYSGGEPVSLAMSGCSWAARNLKL
jgi:hypothetical protein